MGLGKKVGMDWWRGYVKGIVGFLYDAYKGGEVGGEVVTSFLSR